MDVVGFRCMLELFGAMLGISSEDRKNSFLSDDFLPLREELEDDPGSLSVPFIKETMSGPYIYCPTFAFFCSKSPLL